MSAPTISSPSDAMSASDGPVSLLPARIAPPADPMGAEDIRRWRDEFLAANAHLPLADRYAALSGELSALLGIALARSEARERTVEELRAGRRA